MTAYSYQNDGYHEDSGCVRIVDILIDRGAKNFDKALISTASKFYFLEDFNTIELLIEKGATNLNAAPESALVSPYQVTIGVVKLLLEKGAHNLNQALELAFERGRKDIVKLLFERGADDYNSAIEHATTCGREATARFLRSRRDGEDETECDIDLMDEYGMLLFVCNHIVFGRLRP
ncbi:hypothetical protein BDD12DRAFT_889479 [Trichophaea hybrida]|nr:hypothetical protein BDD12DRAFT_889479 [Trichophaea hybrida]